MSTQKELEQEIAGLWELCRSLADELNKAKERLEKLESQKKTKTLVTSLGPRTIEY